VRRPSLARTLVEGAVFAVGAAVVTVGACVALGAFVGLVAISLDGR
jgi:demethoxyubiquinone hydroxylase (CLK1/Coq7/Cat5 family)